MDRRINKTKQAIQEGYFSLLKEGKNRRITISEIARRANVDRKTFYLHYTSPEDIIREFSESKVDELIQRVTAEVQPGENYAQKAFEIFNRMISENREILRFMSDSDAYDYFFAQIKSLLVERILSGGILPYGDLTQAQVEIYVEYFMSGIISAYVRWIREELPGTIDDLSKQIGTVTFGGLQAIMSKSN